MRRSLLSLAVVGLSLAAAPGFALTATQFNTPVIRHPATGAFLLSEVYPVNPLGFGDTGGGNPDQISDNRCFIGTTQSAEDNVNVTPGVFCLGPTVNFQLNVNAFATCMEGFNSPYVQSFRLTKTIPGSQKVPDCFPPAQYVQFGATGIRTWWALKFTQPGTTFCLEVTTRCLRDTGFRRGVPEIHIDKWVWQVGVETATLPLVIRMLHSSALSTMEFPCIADERVYRDLINAASAIRSATTQFEGQNAVFNFEGLVLSECVYGDFVAPDFARGPLGFSAPPGNLPSGTNWAPPQFLGSLTADPSIQGGILDTIENPCCCKLIADVEYIANNLGIVSR